MAYGKPKKSPIIKRTPPTNDFGTYVRVSASLAGVLEILEERRSNVGRVGYASLNDISDITKAAIDDDIEGKSQEEIKVLMDSILAELQMKDLGELASLLPEGFASALPDSVGSFFARAAQEVGETKLVWLIWPVVKGDVLEVPELPTVKEFGVGLQATLGCYIDSVSEMGKKLDFALENESLTSDEEIGLVRRYLKVARSIHFVLAQFRHAPGNVINNGFGRGQGYSDRLRHQVQGTINAVSRTLGRMLFEKNLSREQTVELIAAITKQNS